MSVLHKPKIFFKKIPFWLTLNLQLYKLTGSKILKIGDFVQFLVTFYQNYKNSSSY